MSILSAVIARSKATWQSFLIRFFSTRNIPRFAGRITGKNFQQKTRLSAGSLTEYNANALCSDLSINTIPQKKDNVKYVDLTGIEPANPEFLDPSVHQHQAHTALVYHVLSILSYLSFPRKRESIKYISAWIPAFAGMTLIVSLFTLPGEVSAQISTPSATTSANYQPVNVNSLTPQSPMYANLMVNNLIHAFSCIMAGSSPIGQPCIDYLNGVPVISQINNSGGLLGSVANLNMLVIASPPIRTGEYLATLGDSLGIVKEAHAQVGGSGAGVLDPIMKLWQVSRNIAYVFMIIIFLVIGLMVMFRQRINPQTVITAQAALPGLVIGLILITFSYFFASLLTDTAYLATNLVGFYFSAASDNSSKTPDFNLVEKTKDQNVLNIMGRLSNGINQEDIAKGLSSFFDGLVDPAAGIVRTGASMVAYQFGSAVGPAIAVTAAVPVCGGIALTATTLSGFLAAPLGLAGFATCVGTAASVGGPATGAFMAGKTAQDPPGMIAQGLWVIAILIIIYSMFKLLMKLVNIYLSIIFLVITAPFQFLAAALPGRQEFVTDWIRNMLCNVLAFPAVLAVFYFVNYLLGPVVSGTPFQVGTQAAITGTYTLPLLGGLDISFIRVLLAFGALVATPAVPDIICRIIGKVGVAGQLIGQELSGSTRAGQGYVGQAQGAMGKVQGDIGGVERTFRGDVQAITSGTPGATTEYRKTLSPWAKLRGGHF